MPLKCDRALICAGVFLFVGCSEKSPRSTERATNGTLVIATSAAVNGLFPPLMGSASRQIEEQIYDYLAVVRPDLNTFGDGGFLPRLAESWKWSEDSLSIAFKINARARWHDGVAADAADVRYTYAVYTNPAVGSPDASDLTNVDSVTIPDSRTATFWYHRRSAYQLLDATQMMILPRHQLEKIPMDSLKAAGPVATPIGTGRFRFKRRTSGSSLRSQPIQPTIEVGPARSHHLVVRARWSYSGYETAGRRGRSVRGSQTRGRRFGETKPETESDFDSRR